MPRLEIRLLGPPQVRLEGDSLTRLRSDKVCALLAYLAVEADRPHRREKLAGLLWPGYPEASARASLRRALADLRAVLVDESADPPYLDVTRQTIQFDATSEAWVDVTAFTRLIKPRKLLDEAAITGWEGAVQLYRGEFMEGFSLPDSPAFDEWMLLNREQLGRQMVETLEHLGECLEERGVYQRGLAHIRRAAEIDPLRESAQRGLMRLLALSGQREAALSQYDACSRVLAAELGVEPSAETSELYELIVRGDFSPVAPGEDGTPRRPPRQVGESPYRGLASFKEQDAPFFFGREAFTENLLAFLQRGQVMVAVLGSSGSGKSSVAYAGLLPRLRDRGNWLVASFRPGVRPFYSLIAALLPMLERDLSEADRLIESQKLADALMQGDLTLSQIIDRILEVNGAERCLLLIDQFEELYTLSTGSAQREHFLDRLLGFIETREMLQGSPYAVLLTMRADFMGEALSYRPFADALQQAVLMLGPMTRAELRSAIEKPAEAQGAVFEEGLVERILDDVGREPGGLPLLEFALTLLWEGVSAGWLTHAVYERIGGVQGALARYAEQVYGELDEGSRQRAQHVFLQLVRPGEGTEDTRRIATGVEIGEANWALVQHLADKRLVVTGMDELGSETVEIVHEALVANWKRLRSWIEADRAFRTWQERLRGAQRQWQESGRDEGALLRGAPLAEAERWLAERETDLSQPELDYLQASLDLRRRRRAEQERSRQRVVLGLSVGLVVTLLLAVFAAWQWRSAQQSQARAEAERDQTRAALSRSLASQAQLLVAEELDLATLLSVEAVNIDPSVEARSSLLAALAEKPQLASLLGGYQDEVRAVAFSPDGRLLAAGDASGGVYLREFQSADTALQSQVRRLTGHTEGISSLAFSPDGRLLASAGFDDAVYLWDVASGEQAGAPLTGHSDNVWALAFSPDGETLVTGGADGEIMLWDLGAGMVSSGQQRAPSLTDGLGLVSSLAYSPDGAVLAAGSSDGRVTLWDMRSLEPLGRPLAGHDRLVRALAFSPDGWVLATGSDDRRIVLWDVCSESLTFGQPIGVPLTAHDDWLTSLSFSVDGDSLTSAGKDGRVLLWDLSSLREDGRTPPPKVLAQGRDPFWSLARSSDGRWLVTGGERDHALVWDSNQVHPLADVLGDHTLRVDELIFSPDSQVLAAAFTDVRSVHEGNDAGTIDLWQIANGQPILQALVADPWGVIHLAYSPDGKILATAGGDNLINLWDVDSGSETFGEVLGPPLRGHLVDVTALAFNPNGKILVSGGEVVDNIMLWDADPDSIAFGGLLANYDIGHKSPIQAIHFSQGGNTLIFRSNTEVIFMDMSTSPPQILQTMDLPVLSVYPPDLTASVQEAQLGNKIAFLDLDPDSPTFGEQLGRLLTGFEGWVWRTVINSDGSMLASTDNSGQLRLWDLSSRQPLGPPLINSVTPAEIVITFSPDGHNLASGDVDGNVILWDLDLEVLDRACLPACQPQPDSGGVGALLWGSALPCHLPRAAVGTRAVILPWIRGLESACSPQFIRVLVSPNTYQRVVHRTSHLARDT